MRTIIALSLLVLLAASGIHGQGPSTNQVADQLRQLSSHKRRTEIALYAARQEVSNAVVYLDGLRDTKSRKLEEWTIRGGTDAPVRGHLKPPKHGGRQYYYEMRPTGAEYTIPNIYRPAAERRVKAAQQNAESAEKELLAVQAQIDALKSKPSKVAE